MSRSKILIKDILEMVNRIESSVKKVGSNFKNKTFYDSTLMRLQVIGENVSRLSREELRKFEEVDWDVFIRFRNIVSHNYFAINHKVLNDILKNELPKLKAAIKDMEKKF